MVNLEPKLKAHQDSKYILASVYGGHPWNKFKKVYQHALEKNDPRGKFRAKVRRKRYYRKHKPEHAEVVRSSRKFRKQLLLEAYEQSKLTKA